MNRYDNITNYFSGRLFQSVRDVSLFDERPFEHEFFIRISRSFPLMKQLTIFLIINHKMINNVEKEKNSNEDLSIIEYPYLTQLDLLGAHDDYVEQFLINTKMRLLNNVSLYVIHGSLERVTHNFKRDATRINCAKSIIYVQQSVMDMTILDF